MMRTWWYLHAITRTWYAVMVAFVWGQIHTHNLAHTLGNNTREKHHPDPLTCSPLRGI